MELILNSNNIDKILDRITLQIIENHSDLNNVLLVGIKTRGYPLARRIKERILKLTGIDLYVDSIDITSYRDDKKIEDPIVKASRIHTVNDKDIIIFDDVISTSRTFRAALSALFELGRPKSVELCVLVDRGGRELPFEPNYLGIKCITRKNEKIGLKLKEIDNEDIIYLE